MLSFKHPVSSPGGATRTSYREITARLGGRDLQEEARRDLKQLRGSAGQGGPRHSMGQRQDNSAAGYSIGFKCVHKGKGRESAFLQEGETW